VTPADAGVSGGGRGAAVIVHLPQPTAAGSALEALAAKEIRRYWYARTGRLPTITATAGGPLALHGEVVVVGTHGRVRRLLAEHHGGAAVAAFDAGLAGCGGKTGSADAHAVTTVLHSGSRHVVAVSGASPKAVLYAGYTFAEHALGARFLLHGDILPPADPAFTLPAKLGLSLSPAFALRGLQPFHDFVAVRQQPLQIAFQHCSSTHSSRHEDLLSPQGPDWWTADDHAVVLTQLTKMKMNFIGMSIHPAPSAALLPPCLCRPRCVAAAVTAAPPRAVIRVPFVPVPWHQGPAAHLPAEPGRAGAADLAGRQAAGRAGHRQD
jgi:hypothetical protein